MNDEAVRQGALLAALRAPDAAAVPALRESAARAARGLQAYRANAEAIADRALASAFATVRALVGERDFSRLAAEFLRAQPPQRGDLGEWGDGFAGWLAAHPALAPWPYLGDCARLDLALHRNERAADAVLDGASLARLESVDPARLRLLLMPGTALVVSRWPIASIHAAHQLAGAAAGRAFEAVREAIAAARGERVLVLRQGWRAVTRALDEVDAVWVQCLLDGVDLEAALQRAGEAFDFAAWLATALRESWLKGVLASGD